MALIQAILPTLVMIANRDRQACLDDYIGEAWVVIVNFPLSRTTKVCTNVALDCLHAISSRRQRSSPETPAESINISAPEVQEPGRWRRTCSVQLRSSESSLRQAHQYCVVCGWRHWIALPPHDVITPALQRCELDALGRAGP